MTFQKEPTTGESKKIQERTIQNRKKLIDAATLLFHEKGYYHTDTKEIAKTAGISTGSFYNYFSDKTAIYEEIVKDYVTKNGESLESTLTEMNQSPANAKEIIQSYVKNGMQRAYNHMQIFKDYESIAQNNTTLIAYIAEQNLVVQTLLLHFFEHNQYIKKRTAPEVMAQISFFLVEGISKFISSLPDTADKVIYEEQLISLIIWYMFGDEK